MKTNKTALGRMVALAGSRNFFRAVVAFLVLQAAWIALTGRYPMAFDEDFHFGLIRLYADHPNPFWNAHPAGGDAFGALARDPSYFYHWLMSFPYRFIRLFIDSQTLQVLFLRGINIGLFATGLPLYRRLLLKTGVSKALVNLVLLVFVLVPVVPLLAAQINYDNLIIPLTALALLLAVRFMATLKTGYQDISTLLQLLLAGLLGALVKYAFLPVFAAIAASVAVLGWRTHKSFGQFRLAVKVGWRKFNGAGKWLLVALVLLVSVLFIERYGVNLVRYHTPIPDCAQVLTYERCSHYPVWIRDYNFERSKGNFDKSPLAYSREWIYGMWLRSFFAVDGPATDFQTKGPLTVPALGAAAFVLLGVLALLVRGRAVWRRYNGRVLGLFGAATILYLALLWLTEYRLYLQTGQPLAINGRYLLPVLPLILLIVFLAFNEVLDSRRRLKAALAALLIVCFLWGGGALTYILRSEEGWYWPHSDVKAANQKVQNSVGPLVPGYRSPIQYLR